MQYLLLILLLVSHSSMAETINTETHSYNITNAHFLSEMCLLEVQLNQKTEYCAKFRHLFVSAATVKRQQEILQILYNNNKIDESQTMYLHLILYRVWLNNTEINRLLSANRNNNMYIL